MGVDFWLIIRKEEEALLCFALPILASIIFVLAESLFDQKHELLLSFIGNLHIFDELAKLYRSVVGQQERFTCFG